MTTDIDDDLCARAEQFAREQLDGHFRDGVWSGQRPAIDHMQEVAELVKRAGWGPEEQAAAWLHDLVEDTSVTIDDIHSRFGFLVAGMVDGLTDEPYMEHLVLPERKRRQAERLAGFNESVKVVKISDQISNLRQVTFDPPTHWSNEMCLQYISGAELVTAKCSGISDILDYELLIAVRAARAARSVPRPAG